MNSPMIFMAILVLAMVISCDMAYGNITPSMDEVDMTTAHMFLATESNGEGATPSSFAKRWYPREEGRWRRRREEWRPHERYWRRW
jgi:hypothetical protein